VPPPLSLETLPGRDTPTVLPAGFAESVVAAGFDAPTALEVAPDGRLFVAQQGGQLYVVTGGSKAATPALDLSARLSTAGERGLLGLAFDPNFAANAYLYAYYTRADPLNNRVSRFTVSGSSIDPASEVVLVDLDPLSAATNHNGGALHFAADGTLLVATGENANPPNAQSIATRLGKILRYNRDGSIPADNPATFDGIPGTTTGANRAIYAVGFRNPFTFAVLPGTGTVFVNDVGQSGREEVDRLAAGKNYGWPVTEGDFDPAANPAFTRPVVAYAHGADPKFEGFAIAGGAFYAPTTRAFPADYAGTYFFADFVNNWIDRRDPATGAVTNFASGLTGTGVTDLDVTADGDLLYTSRGSGTAGQGAVYPSLSTRHFCSPFSSRDVAMCLASAKRVRGVFGFFGPRVAFRYRPRFAPRANPISHSAIRPTDHPPISTHVSAGTAIPRPGHAPDTSNAKW
jgi:glucose/arabinose dehydrogenase